MKRVAYCLLLVFLATSTIAADETYRCETEKKIPAYTDNPENVKGPCRLHVPSGKGSLSVVQVPGVSNGAKAQEFITREEMSERSRRLNYENLVEESQNLVIAYKGLLKDRYNPRRPRDYKDAYWKIQAIRELKADVINRAKGASLKPGELKVVEDILSEIPS